MSCENGLRELLPFYVAGTLGERDRGAVEVHLASCAECRADLALWNGVEEAIIAGDRQLPPAPIAPLQGALSAVMQPEVGVAARTWQLLCAQIPLVQKEIWVASGLVMGLGFLLAAASGGAEGGRVLEAIAPLVAAVGVAMIHGPENDPALELALATPTSPRQVLLSRLLLVFGYNLLLALAATLGLLAVAPPELLGMVILGWLGPMTLLSALALVLSLRMGASTAIAVGFALWMVRWTAGGVLGQMPVFVGWEIPAETLVAIYEGFWRSTALQMGLAALLMAASLWMVNRQGDSLRRGGSASPSS